MVRSPILTDWSQRLTGIRGINNLAGADLRFYADKDVHDEISAILVRSEVLRKELMDLIVKDKEAFEIEDVDLAELTANGNVHYNGDKLTPDDRTRLSKNRPVFQSRGHCLGPKSLRSSIPARPAFRRRVQKSCK